MCRCDVFELDSCCALPSDHFQSKASPVKMTPTHSLLWVILTLRGNSGFRRLIPQGPSFHARGDASFECADGASHEETSSVYDVKRTFQMIVIGECIPLTRSNNPKQTSYLMIVRVTIHPWFDAAESVHCHRRFVGINSVHAVASFKQQPKIES